MQFNSVINSQYLPVFLHICCDTVQATLPHGGSKPRLQAMQAAKPFFQPPVRMQDRLLQQQSKQNLNLWENAYELWSDLLVTNALTPKSTEDWGYDTQHPHCQNIGGDTFPPSPVVDTYGVTWRMTKVIYCGLNKK